MEQTKYKRRSNKVIPIRRDPRITRVKRQIKESPGIKYEYYPDHQDIFRIPTELILAGYSRAEMICYAKIDMFKRYGCYVAAGTLAPKLNLSQVAVQLAVQKLTKYGLIQRIPRYMAPTGKSKTTLITTGELWMSGVKLEFLDKRHIKDVSYPAREYLEIYNSLDRNTRNLMKKAKVDVWFYGYLNEFDIRLRDLAIAEQNRPPIFKERWRLKAGTEVDEYKRQIKDLVDY